MSYKRRFSPLVGLLLAAGGCTDEFPEERSALVSDDGVYRVTLELGAEDMHAGEPADMEFMVHHDGEPIDVEMPELHYEQHPAGSDSGEIDLEAGHMGTGHHAMHAFASAGEYELAFSFMAEVHADGEVHPAGDPHADEDGGEAAHEEGDAGTADTHVEGERIEHHFTITVQEAGDHAHEPMAPHADDSHAH